AAGAACAALVATRGDDARERRHARGDPGVGGHAHGRATDLAGTSAGRAHSGDTLDRVAAGAAKPAVACADVVAAADLPGCTARGRADVARRRDDAGETGRACGLASAARLIGAAAG